ncbi:phosphonate metabolism transcriptional regulator PhnF [Aliishimia ponticola]|uniref:Phosphonate metabolism transcriptional regulator PhnF n=1 Tax=Aliishimia ponticola TaxID=2499833 RepID=A0A4S4NCL8_9RHOB|nr:phosphonate metabolism transcriptional regulator PhnF [Aliishimia ponticola]THH37184.1 phosphonate metabolism transcriptional regulator PhnF [Aliishimia ponticola]
MTKTPLWQAIAESVRRDIADKRYTAGDKLPTEAALSGRFGVNRHTIRRALKALGEEGLVFARRGAGVFIASDVTEYPIGRRVRFHQNLRAAGRSPAKKLLALETRGAAQPEAEALRIDPGAPVVAYFGLSLSDDAPIALVVSAFPAERLPGISDALAQNTSITAALAAAGVDDYTRASTRLTAVAADATQALHLHVVEGAPLLRSQSVNISDIGPVEYGTTWFAGERTALIVEEDPDAQVR